MTSDMPDVDLHHWTAREVAYARVGLAEVWPEVFGEMDAEEYELIADMLGLTIKDMKRARELEHRPAGGTGSPASGAGHGDHPDRGRGAAAVQ